MICRDAFRVDNHGAIIGVVLTFPMPKSLDLRHHMKTFKLRLRYTMCSHIKMMHCVNQAGRNIRCPFNAYEAYVDIRAIGDDQLSLAR